MVLAVWAVTGKPEIPIHNPVSSPNRNKTRRACMKYLSEKWLLAMALKSSGFVPQSPCTIRGGRASWRAGLECGSAGASHSLNREKPLSARVLERRCLLSIRVGRSRVLARSVSGGLLKCISLNTPRLRYGLVAIDFRGIICIPTAIDVALVVNRHELSCLPNAPFHWPLRNRHGPAAGSTGNASRVTASTPGRVRSQLASFAAGPPEPRALTPLPRVPAGSSASRS